jgi:hypothetical protein
MGGANAGPGVGTMGACGANAGADGTRGDWPGGGCVPGVEPDMAGGTATGEGAPPAIGGATPTIVPLSLLGGPPLAPGGAPIGRGGLPAAGAGGPPGAAPAGGTFGIWG